MQNGSWSRTKKWEEKKHIKVVNNGIWRYSLSINPNSIHGTGIFTYIEHILPLETSKCRYINIPYMDGMRIVLLKFQEWTFWKIPFGKKTTNHVMGGFTCVKPSSLGCKCTYWHHGIMASICLWFSGFESKNVTTHPEIAHPGQSPGNANYERNPES